ncbi:hypothetical protein [Pseudomonas guariconensis]|uniref:hypothetical protein n=1 Tax=Pseudomonas guariconensis TaxID=1288410 RepID=UPI0018A8F137|nr:hypothetical protein [Pseudomonas guariconensis]MBF8720528.1 hypothetical protein [Pseudomonas guariconensis]MBF8792446.1 hypothetical protein [Pseudomonas monteilii]
MVGWGFGFFVRLDEGRNWLNGLGVRDLLLHVGKYVAEFFTWGVRSFRAVIIAVRFAYFLRGSLFLTRCTGFVVCELLTTEEIVINRS